MGADLYDRGVFYLASFGLLFYRNSICSLTKFQSSQRNGQTVKHEKYN